MISRRAFLAGAACAAFQNDTLDRVGSLVSKLSGDPLDAAADEDFWLQIQQAFALDRNIVNLNNGGCSPSPRVVQECLERWQRLSNQAPSYFMWRQLEPEIEHVRSRLARMFGCSPEEVAITRNASEALEICLNGFDLEPGDEILTTNLDYPRMITTIGQRERRDGIKMVQVQVPVVPADHASLLEPIRRAITPRTRLILVSQVSFMNGQIFPIRQITQLGAERKIKVIVDGAHAFAQFPFSQRDLGCEYFGSSLHKWLMAPMGTGLLYVQKGKIEGLWPLMAASAEMSPNIRKFEEIGTHPAANHNAISEAITFNELIGLERKAVRLRELRQRWVNRVRELPGVRFHTNLDPAHSCGLTTVEVLGYKPAALQAWLFEKKGIFTTPIDQPTFRGLRITPNVYTTMDEIDRFAEAMIEAATVGIG